MYELSFPYPPIVHWRNKSNIWRIFLHFPRSKTRICTNALITVGFENVFTFVTLVIGIFAYGAQYLIRWIFITYICRQRVSLMWMSYFLRYVNFFLPQYFMMIITMINKKIKDVPSWRGWWNWMKSCFFVHLMLVLASCVQIYKCLCRFLKSDRFNLHAWFVSVYMKLVDQFFCMIIRRQKQMVWYHLVAMSSCKLQLSKFQETEG